MPAVKVSLLFNAGTVDAGGNAARVAGFSESYYTTLPIDSSQVLDNWHQLAIKRAALMPANTRIIGGRFHNVDPVGGSRSYDNVYVGTSTSLNDLPGVALQWTVRSATTPNQRSLILRGIPDARVVTGEYSPSVAYNSALSDFFNELKTNWRFRAIDRTILPVKIITIVGGVMTTVSAHGLAIGDRVNVMSTKVGTDAVKTSYLAIVGLVPTATTANLFLPGRGELIPVSNGGRARKALIIYPNFSISTEEIVVPVAMHRKAGGPFRKFRGRRTARH